jgi:hypothetical protein
VSARLGICADCNRGVQKVWGTRRYNSNRIDPLCGKCRKIERSRAFQTKETQK